MKTGNLIWFIACMLNAFVLPVFALGEDVGKPLDQRISPFAVSNVSLEQAISILNEQCLPLGVIINLETSPQETAEKNMIRIDLKNISIKNAIAKILEGSRSYVWDSKKNIINILPADREHNPDYILNAKIQRLEVKNKDRNEIIDLVLTALNKKTPGKYQVSVEGDTIDKLFLYRLPYEDFGMEPPTPKRYNMTLQNVTVREILNLISEKEQIPWFTSPHDEIKELIVLFFYDSKRPMSAKDQHSKIIGDVSQQTTNQTAVGVPQIPGSGKTNDLGTSGNAGKP